MTAVWDTGAAIRAIDAQSVETCDDKCWCLGKPMSNTKQRMRWFPGEPILRFPLGEEKAA